ncbi:unnamed protein product [Malus baccata var. baccata]
MFNILLCDVELSPYELESLKLGLNLDKFGTRKTFQVLNVKVSVTIVWRLDLGRTPPSWTPLLRCKVNRRARLLDGVAQFAHNKVDLDSDSLLPIPLEMKQNCTCCKIIERAMLQSI